MISNALSIDRLSAIAWVYSALIARGFSVRVKRPMEPRQRALKSATTRPRLIVDCIALDRHAFAPWYPASGDAPPSWRWVDTGKQPSM